MPVSTIFSQFTTITWSPTSMWGVYSTLFLPARIDAGCVESLPSVLPVASSTNHLRWRSLPLGMVVDLFIIPRYSLVLPSSFSSPASYGRDDCCCRYSFHAHRRMHQRHTKHRRSRRNSAARIRLEPKTQAPCSY